MKKALKKYKEILVALIVLILVASVGVCVWYFYPKPKLQPKAPEKPVQVEETPKVDCSFDKGKLFALLSNIRSGKLQDDPRLDAIAQERVNEMNGVSDDHAGFKRRFYNSQLPYGYVYLGENIAQEAGCITPERTFNGWFNSPPHRATMENPRYDRIGIGFYKGVTVTEYGDLP